MREREGRPPFLLVSSHDVRTPGKANVHFIAEALARRGRTRVASIGFSLVSRLNRDARLPLGDRANRVEQVDGIEAFLWRSLLHPVDVGAGWLRWPAKLAFAAYGRAVPATLAAWARESRCIVIESGLSVVLFRALKRINPGATFIYLASDDVATIGCAPAIVEELAATAPLYDRVVLTSAALAGSFPPGCDLAVVPHGIDRDLAGAAGASPYRGPRNAVSVGSMQFDPWAAAAAASGAPDVTVHVIGAGRGAEGLRAPNIVVHDRMPFGDTIPYVAHADVGLALYDEGPGEAYLADTSMKLMQYGFFGLPAVCPEPVVGPYPGRFGYRRGDAASVASALRAALAAGRLPPRRGLGWDEVTDRILGLDEGSHRARRATA